MSDPLFLTLDEVLLLHAEAMEHFGGAGGVRDLGLIESAVAMPQQMYGEQFLHSDLAEMAAAYLFHLASNHGFIDGNKRVATRAAYVFLALNGRETDFPVDATERLVLAVASGTTSKEQVIDFFRSLLT